jgi:hypothetical protein
VLQVIREQLVLLVQQVQFLDQQVRQDQLEQLGLLVILEQREAQDLLVQQEQVVQLDLPVQLDLQVQLVQQEQREQQVRQAQQVQV